MTFMGKSLSQVFDPSLNALNALRLIMAISVIVVHAWPLTGRSFDGPAGELGVDGFFILSGFLITRSWLRHPSARHFLVARARRILPAFYVALFVTAFVLAPLGVALQGGDGLGLLLTGGPISYVLQNAGIYIFEHSVNGTPLNVPFPGVWNGSLWTLQWEVFCYLGIFVLGVIGVLSRKWAIPAIAAAAWLFYAFIAPHLNPDVFVQDRLIDAARFSLLFMVGALVYRCADRIPVTWGLAALATALFIASLFLDDYRALGVWPFAYALISVGSLVKHNRLAFRNDLSYGMYIYAFPVEQVLVCAGLASLPVLAYAGLGVLFTIPLAAASWFLLEKPLSRARTATVSERVPLPIR